MMSCGGGNAGACGAGWRGTGWFGAKRFTWTGAGVAANGWRSSGGCWDASTRESRGSEA
jgi:hypothetical protein